jgi:hypothetical protein
MANADWYNSFNLDKTQIAKVVGGLLKCPTGFSERRPDPFIKAVNDRYGTQYENYGARHQQRLKEQWRNYSVAGGLCEIVQRGP